MAETKLASLMVTAGMDASSFSKGASEVDAAARKAGAGAKSLGDAINTAVAAAGQVDAKLRPANDSLERLKRMFVDGYGSAQNLERALNTISNAMARGALSAERAAQMAGNAVKKYGQFDDAARFAARGQVELTAAIEKANASLARQNGMRPGAANQNMIGGHQFAAQNLMYQFQDIGVTAAMGMNPLMIAMQQGTQISAALGPMGAAGAVSALRAAFVGLINPVSLVTVGLVAAGAAAIQYLMPLLSQGDDAVAKLEKQRDAIDAIAKKWGEVAPAFKAYADERERMANLDEIKIAVEGGTDAAWAKIRAEIEATNTSVADYFQQAQTAGADTGELREAQDAWGRLRREVEGGRATAETARSAQKELMDLFAETGIPGVKEQADAFTQLAAAISAAAAEADAFARQGGARTAFEQLRVLPGANERGFLINDPTRPSEYNDELNRRAAEAQAEERRRIEEANRTAGIGIPIPVERPKSQFPMIDSEELSAREKQIDLLRKEAGARRDLAALVTAGATFDQGQRNEIAALEQRARVIGMTADAAARSNAIFQAEMQMRQAGLSLLGEEADRRRAVAAATADYASAIQRSEQAYQSLQTAGGSAIDALFAQTGSLEDRLQGAASAMLKWVTDLALVNPLKNALLPGSNLPTLADLGKPASPLGGMTSTGTMTVTAGVVNVGGGFPSIPGTSTPGTTQGSLLDVLRGAKPTNSGPLSSSVDAVNALRPTSTAPTNSIEAYIRSEATRLNMNPDTAVAVAKSEGGLQSWNMQSQVINSAGVRENSWGPFQLYKDGGLGNVFQNQTGLDPALAENGPQATTFALEYAKKNGWGSWYGARNSGISNWEGINPGVDPQTTNSTSNALKQLSTTTATATKDISGLASSSQTAGQGLMDLFKSPAGGSPATGGLPTTSPNFFPPAPSAPSGNPFAALFGGIFKLFGFAGFADGTDFAPGGVAMVGERGRELVHLPRGSQVIPNHKLIGANSEERRRYGTRQDVDVRVKVDQDGNWTAAVERIALRTSEATTRAGLYAYDTNVLADRMQQVAENPYDRG